MQDALERRRKANRLSQPVHHLHFKLGRCWRRLPEHALRCHRTRGLLGKDPGWRGVGRKVGEEARVLTVCHPFRNDSLEIRKNRFYALGCFRRRIGNLRRDCPGFGLRTHWPGP